MTCVSYNQIASQTFVVSTDEEVRVYNAPHTFSFDDSLKRYDKWYVEKYLPALKQENRAKFYCIFEWLEQVEGLSVEEDIRIYHY